MPQAQFDDMVGRLILGRYRIVRLLARGGMGSIYLARNKGAAGFVRPAVVKKILPSYLGDASAVEMFAREARIMSNLRHPGIVNIIDFSEEDGAYVMVLEYVHGTHSGRWLRYLRKIKQPFPVELALQILIHTLDALDYAHTATALDGTSLGVIHRDIKPSNILVDVTGHVKLADFGIARAPNDRTEVSSGTTKLKGTFPYLAPEIFDDAEPSPGTDVYACGVVLHTLLTGRNEFSAKEVSTTIMRVLEHAPTPLVDARPDVSQALSAVVARSLSKDPSARYQTAADLAAALREVRELSEADANEMLRQSATRDMRDQRFAALLRIDDLGTLERALTQDGDDLELTSEIVISADETEPSIGSYAGTPTAATVPTAPHPAVPEQPVELGSEVPDQPSQRSELDAEAIRAARLPTSSPSTESVQALSSPASRRTWPIVLGLIIAAGMLGGGIVYASYLFRQPGEPGQVIVVGASKGDVATSEDDSASSEPEAPPDEREARSAGDGDEAEAQRDAGHSAKRVPKTPTKPNVQAIIDGTMRRRSGAFRTCFQNHPELSKTMKSVRIKMKVSKAGKVRSAEVVDRQAAGHPLGGCLEKVAGATRFRDLPRDISFAFPLYPNVR